VNVTRQSLDLLPSKTVSDSLNTSAAVDKRPQGDGKLGNIVRAEVEHTLVVSESYLKVIEKADATNNVHREVTTQSRSLDRSTRPKLLFRIGETVLAVILISRNVQNEQRHYAVQR